jgi:cytochrome P450
VQQKICQDLNEKRGNDGSGKPLDDSISLFRHIAASDISETERSEERLVREAQVLLGAGTASTARTVGFASYYILSRPNLKSALREELSEIMREWPACVPSWPQLERLPLLQAVVKESLR